jgi:hypothetical protein
VADHEVVERSMSRSRPAASASAVRCRSSGLGVGRPTVVVDEDDPRRVDPDGVAEQLADPHERGVDVALVDRHDAEDDVLRVEEHRSELLPLEATHLEDEPVGDIGR